MYNNTQASQFAWRESVLLAVVRVCVILWSVVAPTGAIAQQGARAGTADGDVRRLPLHNGDFQSGDRIIVVMRGDSISVDTVTVQSDRTVVFQKLPPISLDGVLRSQVQSYLGQQIGRYVKREVVRATPLVPVGVLGEVVHPGYYRVPLQITLGDLLMVAGGPSPQADLTRVRVRRGQSTLIDEHTIRDAMVRGLPLGALGIDAGDEVVLTPTRQRNWILITQIAGVATGLLLTLHSLKAF